MGSFLYNIFLNNIIAKVNVLIHGYFLDDPPGGKACSTVTLVKDGKIKMIIDPGTTKNQKVIINALKKRDYL